MGWDKERVNGGDKERVNGGDLRNFVLLGT